MTWIGDLLGSMPPWASLLTVGVALALVYWAGSWAWAGSIGAALWATGAGRPDLAGPAAIGGFLIGWLANCIRHPRARCLACWGKAKIWGGDPVFHNCAVCGGSGQRKRPGSKILRRHRADDGD